MINKNDEYCVREREYVFKSIRAKENVFSYGARLFMFGNGPKVNINDICGDITDSEIIYAIETYIAWVKRNDTTQQEIETAYNALINSNSYKKSKLHKDIKNELEKLKEDRYTKVTVLELLIGKQELIEAYKKWAYPWSNIFSLKQFKVSILDVLGIEDTIKKEMEIKLAKGIENITINATREYNVKLKDLLNRSDIITCLQDKAKELEIECIEEYIARIIDIAEGTRA